MYICILCKCCLLNKYTFLTYYCLDHNFFCIRLSPTFPLASSERKKSQPFLSYFLQVGQGQVCGPQVPIVGHGDKIETSNWGCRSDWWRLRALGVCRTFFLLHSIHAALVRHIYLIDLIKTLNCDDNKLKWQQCQNSMTEFKEIDVRVLEANQ